MRYSVRAFGPLTPLGAAECGVGWGVVAAGLAVGAAAASAYGYDGTYAPAYSYPACGYPDYPPC
ncbi:MAG: hypothetical protein WCF47_07615 [Pseudolabrys sp.]